MNGGCYIPPHTHSPPLATPLVSPNTFQTSKQ
jgi:hypothetical protein